MREVPVAPVGTIDPELLARLTRELSARHTLAEVLAWARAQTPSRAVAEIVTQDEFTHDVVLAWDGATYLVFDTN